MQPGFARLTVVAGEAPAGLVFGLAADTHTIGREGCDVDLSGDARVSPQHAQLGYADGRLVIRDTGSVNGVWVAMHEPVLLASGSFFRLGDQVFRVEAIDDAVQNIWHDGTHLLTSPPRGGTFRVVQIIEGGREAASASAVDGTIVIGGGAGATLSLDGAPALSKKHASLTEQDGGYLLRDEGSVNRTFVKVDEEQALANGDLLWIGGTLLRVDIA